MKFTKRFLLAGTAAMAVAAVSSPATGWLHPGAAGGGGLPALTVEITFPGGVPTASTLVYDIATGTDLGSYVAPSAGFTQRCIRSRNASLANFFVDFRPDTSGGRVEVVFWNGETLGTVATKTFRNLPAYTAVVKLNGVAQSDWRSVASWSIPYHYWGNRWRWQSALRPYIRTASQVFSGGFLPNMSLAAARTSGYTGIIVPRAPQISTPSNNNGSNGDGSAMTNGASGYLYLPFMIPDGLSARLWGILTAGDTGGFRDEEGLITLWQGDWLLNGTASSLNSFMQQAEFFSCQANAVFLPDQVVGGPVDQKADISHYLCSTFCNYGSYYNAVTGMTSGISSGGFKGSISGTTLTVTTTPANAAGIQVGMILKSYEYLNTYHTSGGDITPGTYILNQLTGATGGIGTYTVSKSQTVTNAGSINNILCTATTGEFVSKGDEHSFQTYYLPWVITEDPFYIEGNQYMETASLQASIYYKENLIGKYLHSGNGTGPADPTTNSGINGTYTVPPGNTGVVEERGLGWSVKNVASCYAMTPASGAPSWMLPRSTWAAYSSDLSKFIDWQVASWPTDQWYSVFHSIGMYPGGGGGDGPQTFYKAYAAYSFAFADLVGLPVPAAAGQSAPNSWLYQLTYMFDFLRQTTDPALASGWNVQTPLIHDVEPATIMTNQNGSGGCTPGTSTTRGTGNNCVTTYAQLWTYEGAYMQSAAPTYPANPNPGWIGPQSQLGNAGPLYAACAIAKSRGITGAAAAMAQVSSMIDYSYPQALNSISFRQQDGFDGT